MDLASLPPGCYIRLRCKTGEDYRLQVLHTPRADMDGRVVYVFAGPLAGPLVVPLRQDLILSAPLAGKLVPGAVVRLWYPDSPLSVTLEVASVEMLSDWQRLYERGHINPANPRQLVQTSHHFVAGSRLTDTLWEARLIAQRRYDIDEVLVDWNGRQRFLVRADTDVDALYQDYLHTVGRR